MNRKNYLLSVPARKWDDVLHGVDAVYTFQVEENTKVDMLVWILSHHSMGIKENRRCDLAVDAMT